MRLKGKIAEIKDRYITIESNSIPKSLENYKSELDITIEEEKKQRSMSANGLLWKYLGKLQEALKIPKEELYKEYIRRIGKYNIISLQSRAVDSFVKAYSEGRLGNVVDYLYKGTEYSELICYVGSSEYNTKEMSNLINEVENDLKELGIETEPKEYVDSLLSSIEKGE